MTEFSNLFQACGKTPPGRKPILGGPLTQITPIAVDPEPDPPAVNTGDEPQDPIPPGQPLFKCVTEYTFCDAPHSHILAHISKECVPCVDGAGNAILSHIAGPSYAPECKFFSLECDDHPTETCIGASFPCPGSYKCEEKSIPCPPGFTSNHPANTPGLTAITQTLRDCKPCVTGSPGCVFPDSNCRGFLGSIGSGGCSDGDLYPCIPEPEPVGPPPPGPTTGGGPATWQKCVTEKQYCPPGTAQAGRYIGTLSRTCMQCPAGTGPTPGTSVPGSAKPGVVIPTVTTTESACVYPTTAVCQQACPQPGPLTGPFGWRVEICGEPYVSAGQEQEIEEQDSEFAPDAPGQAGQAPPISSGLQVPSPLMSVHRPAQELLEIQEKNSTVIDINERLKAEDIDLLQNNRPVQKIFDKEFNFFRLPATPLLLIRNTRYLNIFNDTIDDSIAKALNLANSNNSWDENDLYNITDEKITASLNPNLIAAFKILRYPGGEVVGLSKLLQMVRGHIVTGTISKLDPEFYIQVGKAQLQQNFTTLATPSTRDYAARGSINYIIDNGVPLTSVKDNERKSVQINRGRFLNEDLDISIPVDTLLSSTKSLKVPNEGISLEALTPKTSTTPVSVGDSDLLNLGDGGGYYISVSSESGEFPLRTTNLVDSSYYLPDFHKSKVLSLNGVSFASRITASSLSNQNEFVTGDRGASAFEPLYFGMNLGSVSSTYKDNPLIETYTATYSRIVDSDQIARHTNNNAQSLTEFRIGYDDPIYRYILDTSSFELDQEDFTVKGFKDGASSFSFNFPKNIPFAIIIIPVAGSKFNPLNAQSTLLKYSDGLLRRSLRFKPSINMNIDGGAPGRLRSYNLYSQDRSQRIGLVEESSDKSFGYKYEVSSYQNSFYNGSTYTSSIDAVSSFGVAYLLREVIDFIAETHPNQSVTWFDLYRRMPFNRYCEFKNTITPELFKDIKNGFRGGIKPGHVAQGGDFQSSILLPEDSKVIITIPDRESVKAKGDLPLDSDIG